MSIKNQAPISVIVLGSYGFCILGAYKALLQSARISRYLAVNKRYIEATLQHD